MDQSAPASTEERLRRGPVDERSPLAAAESDLSEAESEEPDNFRSVISAGGCGGAGSSSSATERRTLLSPASTGPHSRTPEPQRTPELEQHSRTPTIEEVPEETEKFL